MNESSASEERAAARVLTSPPSAAKNSIVSASSPASTIQQQTTTPCTTRTIRQNRLSTSLTVQPVSTPQETQQGSRTGLVLLSPSHTITESLNALASSTAQQLEEIWDEVGSTPEERASQLSDLLVMFRNQCESKISEELGVAEFFRQTIANSKEEIKTISNSLKREVDPHLMQDNNGETTLTDELANLEAALESLRVDADAAKQD